MESESEDARFKRQPRYRGNGRERFAPETQRRNRAEILSRLKLAGGMMLESQDGVILAHPFAVVPHLDGPLPSRKHSDINSAALGIDGIFQQFLYDRGRPFDNFAGGDFVGKNFRQYADFAHAV